MKKEKIIFLLWILLLFSLVIFGKRTSFQVLSDPFPLARINRLILFPIFCLLLVYSSTVKFFLLPNRKTIIFFFLYGLSGVLGTIIFKKYVLFSLFKFFEFMTIIFTGSLVFTLPLHKRKEVSQKIILITLYFMVVFLLFSSYFWILIDPSKAFTITLRGIKILRGYLPTMGGDGVSLWGSIIGIFFFPFAIRNRKYLLLFIGGVITMLLGHSRAAVTAFVLSFLLLSWIIGKKKITFASLLLLSLIFMYKNEIVVNYFRRGGTDEELATLSMRTEIWKASIRTLRSNPIFGTGFDVGGKFLIPKELNVEIQGIHNAFLEVLVDTGIIGFTFWILAIVFTWKGLIKVYKKCKRNFSKNEVIFLEGLIGVMLVFSVVIFTLSILCLGDFSTCLFVGIMIYVEILENLC